MKRDNPNTTTPQQRKGHPHHACCNRNSLLGGFGSRNVVLWATCIPLFGLWHIAQCFAQYDIVSNAPVSDSVISNGVAYQTVGASPIVVSASHTNHPAYSTPSSTDSFTSSSISHHTIGLRNWPLEVANAQTSLDASKFPDVEISRQRLEQSMANLENFLATSPLHQANWLSFLKWNDLRSEVNKPKPDQVTLTQIEKTFRQNYFGLELSQFTNVRDSLKNYVQALRYGSDREKTMEILNNRLKSLSEQVQLPDFQSNFASTREIGQTLAYLSQAHQSPSLVSSLKSNFASANARVLLSTEFVQRKFSRPVNEPNPVNELILGTQIRGQSLMQGWLMPELVDSASRATVKLTLNGNFSSQNIGYNRSVKLHTQGYGDVTACETIALTDNGLVQLNDTGVDANLYSQINDIEARLKIVRKIASKQAAKQKPLADSIAEGRLETRVRNQFHEQLGQQLAEANVRLRTPNFPVLHRLGLQRPNRTTWSSPQYLALLWKLQDIEQLAAPQSCPLVVQPNGFTVQIHESVITNMTDPILAGRVLRSTEMEALSLQFADALGTKANFVKDEEPWAITMENYHPVEIQLDDSLVTFRIRTTQLDKGDQELKQPAAIEASYAISLIDGAIQLERQGEVKIAFSGRSLSNLRAVSLRSFLKKRFDEVFKQQLLDAPIRLTDKLPPELHGLQLCSVQVDDGWIQAHLR